MRRREVSAASHDRTDVESSLRDDFGGVLLRERAVADEAGRGRQADAVELVPDSPIYFVFVADNDPSLRDRSDLDRTVHNTP